MYDEKQHSSSSGVGGKKRESEMAAKSTADQPNGSGSGGGDQKLDHGKNPSGKDILVSSYICAELLFISYAF
jgi:hypothetical protein